MTAGDAPRRERIGSAAAAPLEKLQTLYDRNLFQQAYGLASEYWKQQMGPADLSIDELVFAIRLASRLGGVRLSRWLSRAALARDPQNPRVRYFTIGISARGERVFESFRELEINPELKDADADTQASWLGFSAMRWASIRDFERAHKCLERARSWNTKDSWIESCASDVLGMEDRWEEALAAAELAWEIAPGTPYAARSLAGSLLNLRRVEEAAQRMTAAAESSESYELPLIAVWYLCAQAETCSGGERTSLLERAKFLASRMEPLAPLADRETRASFARVRLDIAEMADDHEAIERWANEARSPFHSRVLKNFHENPAGVRIRLPFRHSIQKHNECLPTSIGSALAAMGLKIDADAMATELTFGGTTEWAASEWLEQRGFRVRFFAATPEVSARLIKAGFAFTLTLEYDNGAHAVAAVGLDEAAGTLLIHDPQSFRCGEYLLAALGKGELPLGPRAMVAVPEDKLPLLDDLLPQADVEPMAARENFHRAQILHGPSAMREIVTRLAATHGSHPITKLLQALQERDDGHTGAALAQFQSLLQDFPASASVRANLLSCCRSLGNTALMRETLADVVDRGMLPGIQSQQDWVYPPPGYVAEYADLLRGSAQTIAKAKNLLHSLIRRHATCAPAWHVLADLLWNERDMDGALLGYRISAYLADSNEHYAQAYCDALAHRGREAEGLAWLEDRVRKFGKSAFAVATWTTLIYSLEQWGHPERALATANRALAIHDNSAELLAFVVPFMGRLGQWAEAEELLSRLERANNPALFHQASVAFHRMRGQLNQAVEHAQRWLTEMPLSMRVRYQLADLVAKRDGATAAIALARDWLEEKPEHDETQELYCDQLERVSYTSMREYSVLMRRVQRNPHDGWAWRELVFTSIYDFELASQKRQPRLAARVSRFLEECDRVSPDDAATLRGHARWAEARGEWSTAVELWIKAIQRDPASMYSYNRAWGASARLDHLQRLDLWKQMESVILAQPGRSPVARDVLLLAAERFGIATAEESAARWVELRPDDPNVLEGYIDLLLDHGHGRTDYERALELLMPALQRFPFQSGLRFSHSSALKNLGRYKDAEQVLEEIVRRHPDNSAAIIQLAWVTQHHGATDEALRMLYAAADREPQNVRLRQAQVEILLEERRFQEARKMIGEVTDRFPAEVNWRERAIELLTECGDREEAAQVARGGVVAHPRGAYLWLLLGRTLGNLTQFAAPGELEACLRRSLSLNPGLLGAADSLATLLVDQRRYQDAEDVLKIAEQRLEDPSPMKGRLAWVHRKAGKKSDALQEMLSVVRQAPWYRWGWKVLLDWLLEDEDWGDARTILREVAPEMRTDTEIRQHRLEVLQKAGWTAETLDLEWNSLLHDFPENMPLHLVRYDSLKESERWVEAREVLSAIRQIHPNSPYVLARWVEIDCREQKKDEAIDCLMQIFFAETEPSRWPAEFAWGVIKNAQAQEQAYSEARARLAQGQRPTPRAISILGAYAMERGKTIKKSSQPPWRAYLPDRGAREVWALLESLEKHPGAQDFHRASLLQQFSDFGYQRLVVLYWKRHRQAVESAIGSWSELIRALAGLRKRRLVHKLMTGWEQRRGVGMWVIANYVMACPGSGARELREVRSICHDALAGLQHDHCARYLAYREAEACALLRDDDGLLQVWSLYANYFDGKLEKGEWFESKRRYLMADLPVLARFLKEGEVRQYRKRIRKLRWDRMSLPSTDKVSDGQIINKVSNRWFWWILWILLMLLVQLTQHWGSNQ